MNTTELISSYKSAYTPLDEDAKILSFYTKNYSPTSSFDMSLIEVNVNTIYKENIFPSITTLEEFLTENKERQYIKLYSDFLLKWNTNKSHFSSFGEVFVFDNIKVVIDRFLTLKPNYITFDLTDDCSVFFQALVNGKNIYLELFFTNEVKNGVEAIVNVYQNSECIFAYGSTIKDTFSKITSLVKKDYWLNEPTRTAYVLSE